MRFWHSKKSTSASFERSETSSDTVMTSGWHSADVGGKTDCQWWKYIEKSLKTLHWAKTQREHYFEHHCVRTKGNDKCRNVGHSMATEYRKIPSNPFLWWRWASAKLKKNYKNLHAVQSASPIWVELSPLSSCIRSCDASTISEKLLRR